MVVLETVFCEQVVSYSWNTPTTNQQIGNVFHGDSCIMPVFLGDYDNQVFGIQVTVKMGFGFIGILLFKVRRRITKYLFLFVLNLCIFN